MKKDNKGITLVALIITIIVLLILAVVTISAVNEGSLFAHANNAATAYSQKAEEENTLISNYLNMLKEHENELPQGQSNPLIGQEFYMFIGSSPIIVLKDISADGTLSFYDTEKQEWNYNIPYSYDSTNETITVSDQTMNIITLNTGIALKSEEFILFTNGAAGSNLNGYSFNLNGAIVDEVSYYDMVFGQNNKVYVNSGTSELLYGIADDNSNNNGIYYLFIDKINVFTVTKVNGVYTELNYHGITFPITPPQP